VRVLIGGDYGLDITPHGTYARDLEYFVDLFGLRPAQALLCATRDGGAAVDPAGMLGTLEAGKYADLVIVDGDPTRDVRVLQDHGRITAVMKAGQLYRGLTRKNPYLGSADDLAAPRAGARDGERLAEKVLSAT
jgi:imidazolonepropionase-like amidohydrolase